MAMLSRYQKVGGFGQLLQLIETCGKQKQDNFLGIVEKEDANWAAAIRQRMITIEKIFTWDDESIADLGARLQQLTLATVMHSINPEQSAKLLRTFSHSQKRAIEDLKNSRQPTPGEITAVYTKIIEEVRTMIKDGFLKMEKVDPKMVIEDNIEELLGRENGQEQEFNESSTFGSQLGGQPRGDATASDARVDGVPNMDGFGEQPKSHGAPTAEELKELRQKVQALSQENAVLRNEVRNLKEKLTQIKKIA